MAKIHSGELKFRVTGPDQIEILEDMLVEVIGKGWAINAGDRGDLSSYPLIGMALYDPFEGALAGVWHDKRYQLQDCTRKEADQGWYELAIEGQNAETRMSPWKARIGHMALRAGGWMAWNKYKRFNDEKRSS